MFTSFETRQRHLRFLGQRIETSESLRDFAHKVENHCLGCSTSDEPQTVLNERMVGSFLQGIAGRVPVVLFQTTPSTLDAALKIAENYVEKSALFSDQAAFEQPGCSSRPDIQQLTAECDKIKSQIKGLLLSKQSQVDNSATPGPSYYDPENFCNEIQIHPLQAEEFDEDYWTEPHFSGQECDEYSDYEEYYPLEFSDCFECRNVDSETESYAQGEGDH